MVIKIKIKIFLDMRKQKVLFLVCFWLCAHLSIVSQITITPSVGCAPLPVSFSAPAGAANWNFGDGGTSSISNPTHLYSLPGTYIVTYSGIAGNFTQNITVYANNVTANFNFSLPPSGCLPRPVSFIGSGGGPGSLYQWAFGDGGLGTGSTITHTFGLAGVFNVTLTVKDQVSGCEATYAAGPINVSALPNLVINATPGFASCAAPFTTSFTAGNSTSGSPTGGGLTFNWNFGNSQTSGQTTPGNITFAQGIFTVTLTGTDNNSCSNTTTQLVSVVQPTVSVSTPTIRCIKSQEPSSMLNVPVLIQSTQPDVLVDMGDGNPPFVIGLNSSVPTFTYPLYTTPGTKTITVTASAGNCIATATQTLFVEQIVPQFTTSAPFFTCSPTLISNYLNLTNVNSNATLSYTWDVMGFNKVLDPANTTTLTNPTFTFTQGALNPYTIFGMYRPRVILLVSSANGCRTSVENVYDSIYRPTAWFNKNKSQGCAPLVVSFRDTSDSHPLFPIQSYTWSNGGTPAVFITGTIPPPNINPTFTYNTPGTYTPSYTISTAGGCSDVSYVDTVIVVNPSTLIATFPPDLSVCAGEPVTFSLSATPASSLISHWHVETDNGFYSGCVSDSMPTWPFTHLGVHSLTLTGSDHGCKSALFPVQTITVNGPIGKFSYRTNCTNKKSVDFHTHLQDAESAILYFGDGQSINLTGNVSGTVSFTSTHVYGASSDYTANLVSYNSITNCGFTYSTVVTVRQIMAGFDLESVVCKNTAPTFTANSSVDVLAGCGRGYTWFVDTFPPEQTPFPSYTSDTMKTVGIHTITLLVKDINSCTSSLTKTFRVASPDVDFWFNSNPICFSANPVQIINLTPQSPDIVNEYTIDLGTGTPTFAVSSPTDWPIVNNYPSAIPSQTFLVKIRGKDAIGCRDSMEHMLKVNDPFAYIYPTLPDNCVNVPINITVPTGYTNTVDYGDGVSLVDGLGAGTYTHAFTNPGIYTLSLSVMDDGACTSDATATVNIQSYPVANFSFAPTLDPLNTASVFCAPVSITFSSTTNSAFPIDPYVWDLGTGSPIINAPVVGNIFSEPGVKTISLTAYTTNGCASTIIHTLSILSPTANAHVNKTKFCLGETIKVSLSDTSSVGGWVWFFGDGVPQPSVVTGAAPSPTFSYQYTTFPPPFGATTLQLYYYASGGYCDNYVNIPIQVIKIEPDFIRNLELTKIDYEHCVNIEDKFTNKTKVNNGFFLGGMSFLWNFGNGSTSTLQSTSYTYPSPGIYTVSLTVSDPSAGCVLNTSKNMTINPIPTVTVSVADSVCKNSFFTLSSTGSADITEYNWLPSTGIVDPHAQTTAASASVSTTYSLQITNKYGCKGASANQGTVYVQQPPLTNYWDTTVIIGQPINLNTNQGSGFTYTWSPLTDLSCSTCPYPVSASTVNITYSVEVQDPLGCFRVTNTYTVIVDPLTSVDVPTAFTPNGDGVNDVIYVDGWGIKRLIYFRIFNRWGQRLFESNDIKTGWDGTYNGVPQNMETYIYQVSVETYVPEKTMEKTSSFRLIR